MPGLRDRITDAAYGLGWSVVCRVPESWARGAFRFGANIAWRRQGPRVQLLEANLRRVLGQDATQQQLRAVSRESMESYARYWGGGGCGCAAACSAVGGGGGGGGG